MANLQAFESFLSTSAAQINIYDLLFSLILAIVFAQGLKMLYIKYGRTLSNRHAFADNFVLLALTTTLIITVVKSSLALSLGLVGALSIVRFRAAIKEPEELSYLFLNIAVGLGLGANQHLITTVALAVVALFVIIRGKSRDGSDKQNLYLSVSGKASANVTLDRITRIIKSGSEGLHLKRYDTNGKDIDATFLVDIKSFDELDRVMKELRKLSDSLNLNYIDR